MAKPVVFVDATSQVLLRTSVTPATLAMGQVQQV